MGVLFIADGQTEIVCDLVIHMTYSDRQHRWFSPHFSELIDNEQVVCLSLFMVLNLLIIYVNLRCLEVEDGVCFISFSHCNFKNTL